MVHMCKRIYNISRCFLHFFQILIFGVNSGIKVSNSVSQELYFIWLWLWVHMRKMIYPAIFFLFFQNSDFSGFSKCINKWQKEILKCAPPSSHMGDFLFNFYKYSKFSLLQIYKQHFKFFKCSNFCFPNLFICEYLSKPFIWITTVKFSKSCAHHRPFSWMAYSFLSQKNSEPFSSPYFAPCLALK